MKVFPQNLLYANDMCARFESQKIYTQKYSHNLPTCVVVGNNGETILLLPTLTSSQGLKFYLFTMKFLAQDVHHVSNLYAKF